MACTTASWARLAQKPTLLQSQKTVTLSALERKKHSLRLSARLLCVDALARDVLAPVLAVFCAAHVRLGVGLLVIRLGVSQVTKSTINDGFVESSCTPDSTCLPNCS